MRYKEYKKVDIPWLDEIPSHWEIERGKFFIYSKKEINKDKKIMNVLSLTLNGVIRNDLENPIGLSPSDYSTYQIFKNNDLVFKLIDLDNIRTSRVGLVNELGIMSSAYIREIINKNILFPKYIYYWYYKLYIEEVYNKLGSGVRSTISSSELLEMQIPIPAKEEQEQIARFLDWKINEIDRLIELEKQKIKKLEINFTIIINNIFNAVEGEKVKLKYIFDFGKGLNVTKDDLSENGIKCISYGEIHGKNRFSFSSDDKNLKSLGSHVKLNIFANLNQGDFVFCDTSEDLEGSGNFSYKKDSGIVYASYHTIVAKPKVNFNSEYIAYFFESDLWRAQIRANVKGIKVYSITQFILKDSYIILPDIYTQKKIVKNLNHFKGKKINLVNNISATIKNLESLKQSLISDVVTGRIDVRGIEIPNYDKVYDIEEDAMLGENFEEEV